MADLDASLQAGVHVRFNGLSASTTKHLDASLQAGIDIRFNGLTATTPQHIDASLQAGIHARFNGLTATTPPKQIDATLQAGFGVKFTQFSATGVRGTGTLRAGFGVIGTFNAYGAVPPNQLGAGFVGMHDQEPSDTPAISNLTIGDGQAGESVEVSLDGATLVTGTLNTFGATTISVPLPVLAAGTHTLTISGAVSGSTTLDLNVLADPLPQGPDDDAAIVLPAPPAPDPAHALSWRLVDTNGTVYVFPRNPESWTMPVEPTFVTHEATTAPDGQMLAWEASQRPFEFQFTGHIQTKDEYDQLALWASHNRRFWLFDHRGEPHLLTFKQFDAVPQLVPNSPWAHTYTITALHFFKADAS